jgi:uncharacterized protein YabE (DUF348 family)
VSDVHQPRAVLAQLLALGVLITGGVAFASMQRTVTVSVDGQEQTVQMFARTVGEALERAEVSVGSRDYVDPAPSAAIADGERIVVRTARPLVLDLDERGPQVVWTTAQNVDEALTAFGVRAEGAYLSVSRSSAIPRDGLAVEVRTPQTVNVLVDGERQAIETTAKSYWQVLQEAGVTLGKKDYTSENLTQRPEDNAVLAVTRVAEKTTVKSVPVTFTTEVRKDSSKFKGSTETVQQGKPGVRVETWRFVWHNGKRAGKAQLVKTSFKVKPVKQIIVEGTKAVPKAPAAVASLNWKSLAKCESGGRPGAVSSTGKYHGLYQFSLPTWRAVGGTGLPSEASAAEQTMRAHKLYQVANWRTQWPVCGIHLFD